MTQPAPDAHDGSVRRRADVLWRCAGGSAVLLAPESEQPLVVSGSGAALWEALAEPIRAVDVVRSLADRFEVDPDGLRADVERALRDLDSAGLLEPA